MSLCCDSSLGQSISEAFQEPLKFRDKETVLAVEYMNYYIYYNLCGEPNNKQ